VDGWLRDKIITKKDNSTTQNTVSVKFGEEKIYNHKWGGIQWLKK
jgi:hypothetical protein